MTFPKAWTRAGLAVGLSLGLTLGLALAAGVAPASAADWGGIKDTGGGVPVPVPAPEPVPTYDWDSDWYIGGTIGAIISQNATIDDSDPFMPMKDAGDIGASPIFGINFGRYITPSLRAEIAIDYSPDSQLTPRGRLLYEESISAPNPSNGIDTRTYGVVRTDTAKLSRTTGLVNLLYDIHTGTRFTPYIGGGVGFSWRSIKRTYSENSSCGATADFPGLTCAPVTSPALQPSFSHSGSNSESRLDFAAAVQAGIAYDLTDSITWDNGWQMFWEGGAIAQSEPTLSDIDNRITYKDAVLQQFRSGIRIKFN